MTTVAHSTLTGAQEVLLYGRNSTDDQAEAGTIRNQQDFLGSYTGLYGLNVIGAFWDEGYSGTIPLRDRPDGRRLLEAARQSPGAAVLVYRLDRLGRSLRTLLDAHDQLDRAGVTIRSATEPFDTATPIGRFLFQLLASLAELERSTILERMTLGRDRVARDGKWTSGPIPFGYDADEGGYLIPSTRLVDGLDLTEAEVARSVFENVADGSTTVAECRRLNAQAIPTHRRYASGAMVTVGEHWLPSRINNMIKSSTYIGTHVFKSRHGPVARKVPALVDRATWERAQVQLVKNRALSTRNAKTFYLLRGLIRCGNCGQRYAGTTKHGQDHFSGMYYRCNGQLGALRPDKADRCRGRWIKADWIEGEVWEDVRKFVRDPGGALAEAQRQLRDRLSHAAALDDQRRQLQRALDAKDAERERVMTLFRRGRVPLADAERELDQTNAEAAQLRAQVQALQSQQDLAQAFEAHYTEATTVLAQLAAELEEIERTNDLTRKRQVVELLVSEIRITTTRQGTSKPATLTIRYTFARPRAVEITNDNCACSRRRG
jgi:site-specific DNA recombinase